MCQSDNNTTIEQTTAEVHQWVFNVARIPAPVGVLQLAPKNMFTSTVMMDVQYTQETKIKNHTRLTKARGS